MNMRSPLVTTLLPTNVLNPWVDAAVASALAQDYPHHEVLVIHDGIEPDLARPWVHDERVTCVTVGRSRGLAHALSVGAQSASGDYFSRLDGDDLSDPRRLSAQLAYLAAHPEVAVLGTLAHRIDTSGETTGELGIRRQGDLRSALLVRNILIHSSATFSRQAYLGAGGYDPCLMQMEDYHLWLGMALLGEVHVLPEFLIRYRVHQGQMSRGAAPQGPHIVGVLSARRVLGQHLGVGRPRQLTRDAAWRFAQYARFYGATTTGYDVQARNPPREDLHERR